MNYAERNYEIPIWDDLSKPIETVIFPGGPNLKMSYMKGLISESSNTLLVGYSGHEGTENANKLAVMVENLTRPQ